jgi:BlaI family transcriptional regulator, penicillinase repressor
MVDRPGLSKGELLIARLLWDAGPSTVRAVFESLAKGQEMDFATVQTYLRRLEAKGYATSVLQGKTRIYSAKTKPKTVIRSTVDDLVERLFGGETMPLVRHLIEDRGITEDEIDELRTLIDRLEKEGRKK